MADQLLRPLTFDQMFEGVDSTSDPHLISENAWRTQHNMRTFRGRVQQIARKVRVQLTDECYLHPVLAIANIPTGYLDYGLTVALTREHAYQVRYPGGGIQLHDLTGPLLFAYDSRNLRWATTVYNNQLFFTNEANRVLVSDGTYVRYVGTDAPRARYITHYYDHIIVGWVEMDGLVMPGRMHWSNLYSISQWRPARSNESDLFDFEEDDNGLSSVRGMTGFGKIADLMFVTTPTSIRVVNYVGLPRVFQVGPNLTGGVGSGLSHGLINVNNALYFFDVNEFNFFQFTGQGVQPIGGPVQGYLQENATADPDLQQRTWAYHQPEYQEIVWVFCSRQSVGKLDLGVSFNYRTGRWHTRSVENLLCFGGRIRRALGVDELTNPLTGECRDMGNSGVLTPRVWGGTNGTLWREELTDDPLATLAKQDPAVLETKDYHYGNLQSMKEVNTLTPHMSYTSARGVYAALCRRTFVDDSVTYDAPELWTPDNDYRRITTMRGAGRLLRYKFTPRAELGETTDSIACSRLACRGDLEVTLDEEGVPNDIVPSTYVPVGVTSGADLDSYRAPQALQETYIHGAPIGFDPYTLPQSSGMLADARTYLYNIGRDAGFDGFTEPHWIYISGINIGSQPAFIWPGWKSSIDLISEGWYVGMEFFHFDQQTEPPPGYGPIIFNEADTSTAVCTLPGTHTATFRVRAVASLNTYTGGTPAGFLNTGGTPVSAFLDILKLEISSPAQVFYLNRGSAATTYLVPIDFEFDAPIATDAVVTLTATRSGLGYTQGINGLPVSVAGYPDSTITRARVDYSLTSTTPSSTLTYTRGGGARGWKWSGFTKNISAFGANK